MKLKQRLDKTFDRYGEEFVINGVCHAKGFFQQFDRAGVLAYFNDLDGGMIPQSAIVVMAPAETPAAANDTVLKAGRAYIIIRISDQRVRDTVIMRMLLLRNG